MRRVIAACLFAGAVCGFAQAANAGAKVVTKVKTYDIAGDNGAALLAAMDRKGPKHGFMTHAIAQTNYSVGWDFAFKKADGACRLDAANGTLNLTYSYPRVTSALTPAMKRRWNRFYAAVRTHEETHGRIAREMIVAAAKSVHGLKLASDPFCWKARDEANRRIKAVYDKYEAKQVAFDAREHRDGGHVESLVKVLVGKS